MLCNASQHFWPNFISLVKGENEVWPVGPLQHAMRSSLSLDRPADTQQSRKQSRCLD